MSEMETAEQCPHCPDGHADPTTRPWAVFVAPERDRDGQPTHLYVAPTGGQHVAESDAEWLRQVIREAKSRSVSGPPEVDWGSAWTELRGYVAEAVADGGRFSALEMLAYMDELRARMRAPITEWMRQIGGGAN